MANVLHVKKDVALLLCVHLCIYSTLQKQFCLPAKKILVPKGPVSRTIRTVTVKLVYYRLKTTKCSYCVWNYRFTFFSFCILSCCRFTSLTCSSAIALSLKIKNKHILFIIQKAPRAHTIYQRCSINKIAFSKYYLLPDQSAAVTEDFPEKIETKIITIKSKPNKS